MFIDHTDMFIGHADMFIGQADRTRFFYSNIFFGKLKIYYLQKIPLIGFYRNEIKNILWSIDLPSSSSSSSSVSLGLLAGVLCSRYHEVVEAIASCRFGSGF